jgi:PPIC-type PPIASE domain
MSRIMLRPACFLVLPCFLAIAVLAQQPSNPTTSPVSSTTNTVPSSDRVVLKVGDTQVTQAQFEAVLSTLEAQQGPADLSRQAIAENYASLLALSQQAVANHLDTTPDVLRQLAIDRTQILSNAEFANLKAQSKPTPEEISAYYASHLDDYDMVQVRRIFVFKKGGPAKNAKGVDPAQAKPLADAIRQAYASGSDPKKLISNPDDVVLDAEPLAFRRGELPEKMAKPAFTIKEGEWAVIDDTPDALVMLQLVKRSRLTLKETTPFIAKKLQSEKLQAKLDELKKQSGVWLDQAYFASNPPMSGSNTRTQPLGPPTSVQKEKDEDNRQN